MKYRRRIYYSATQRAEIWDRWKRGESMSSIGRVFDRQSSSVFSVISPPGGIRPPGRRRGSRALSLSEREEISRGLSIKRSLRVIAHQLGRAPSTISREVRRNGGSANYRATTSDQAAWDRALRPKTCKLACHPALAQAVSAKLRRKWSPELDCGLAQAYVPEKSAETSVARNDIQKPLHTGARRTEEGVAGASARQTHCPALQACKPQAQRFGADQKRRIDQSKTRVRGRQSGARALGRRSDRRVEEQLYVVERHSRYVMLVKVANKDTESVISGLIKSAQRLPRELYKSLTWDRGKELADHPRLTIATDIDVYFCDPHSPWQRGSNENTNRLLRQYLPRGTDLSVHSQAKLSAIARQLNERPRKTLQYQTPAEKFAECVASIS